MDWIKRNLYFLIFSVVALVLMGMAGWFLYSKWALNSDIMARLNADYENLRTLNTAKPHPGFGQVDNIKAAKEQEQQLKDLIKVTTDFFQRIPPIPDVPKPTDSEFSTALSRTIDRLQHDATNASVALPANYNFSFEAQKSGLSFAAGSTVPLATQLGEVKAICDILFDAKVNSLDGIRRERVCSDDNKGPQADYLSEKTVTNELATITSYEVSFRCFSPELALVLAGFGSSSNGFVIRTINVEPGPTGATTDSQGGGEQNPMGASALEGAAREAAMAAMMRQRYGLGMGGPGGGRYGDRYGAGRPMPQPTPTPTPAPTTAHGSSNAVLDEHQFKVTMVLNLVKLLPPKKGEKGE